jgi:hypothetical protein
VRRTVKVLLAPYAIIATLLVVVFGLMALAVVAQLVTALLRHVWGPTSTGRRVADIRRRFLLLVLSVVASSRPVRVCGPLHGTRSQTPATLHRVPAGGAPATAVTPGAAGPRADRLPLRFCSLMDP